MLVNYYFSFNTIINRRILILKQDGSNSVKNQPLIKPYQIVFSQKSFEIHEQKHGIERNVSNQVGKLYEIVKERISFLEANPVIKRLQVMAQLPFYAKVILRIKLKANLSNARHHSQMQSLHLKS